MFEENLCKHNIHEVGCVVAFGFVRGKSNVCTRKIQMSLHASVMPAVRSRAGMKSWNNIVPLLLPTSSVPPLPFTSPLRSSITIFHTVNTKLSNPWFVPESDRESIHGQTGNWRYFWDLNESSHIPLDAARRESRRRILCKNVRVNYFFPSSIRNVHSLTLLSSSFANKITKKSPKGWLGNFRDFIIETKKI